MLSKIKFKKENISAGRKTPSRDSTNSVWFIFFSIMTSYRLLCTIFMCCLNM